MIFKLSRGLGSTTTYNIKDVRTRKTIGSLSNEEGILKVTGDFLLKKEVENLAAAAFALKGQRIKGVIREERIPLNSKTQLDLIANFINANLSDHFIRVINYDDPDDY